VMAVAAELEVELCYCF